MKKAILLATTALALALADIPVHAFTEYNPENVELLAHVIMGEAEGGSWELKLDCGSVALNRVEDDRFPDTLEEVIWQEGQYAITWDGRWELEPTWECYEAAAYLLEHGSQLPDYCLFQSTFAQADSTYKCYENTYFCYWNGDVR